MKILVLSDSHSALRFMREAVRAVKPDAIIHLGDYYDDGRAIAEENPHIPFHQVPGNCDTYRMICREPEILTYEVCGVRLYMTHGHRHGVKYGNGDLIYEASKAKVDAVLYGHTHIPECYREDDGMWVLNPGSCNYSGGTVGLIETVCGKILTCKILERADLEELL